MIDRKTIIISIVIVIVALLAAMGMYHALAAVAGAVATWLGLGAKQDFEQREQAERYRRAKQEENDAQLAAERERNAKEQSAKTDEIVKEALRDPAREGLKKLMDEAEKLRRGEDD
jgi:flagellar basal body-associated protein FliL